MNLDNLPHNLFVLRTIKRVSARELSVKLNMISDYRIKDIESRKKIRITEDEVNDIAAFFDVTIDQLLNMRADIVFK